VIGRTQHIQLAYKISPVPSTLTINLKKIGYVPLTTSPLTGSFIIRWLVLVMIQLYSEY